MKPVAKPYVLVIEENLAIRTMLQKYVTMENCEVMLTETGEEGLKAVATTSPDLILLSTTIPDIEGLSVLGAINEKNSRVPVVMLTTQDTLAHAQQALNCGASDYLLKPFDFPTVKRLLQIQFRR